ncbi:MAG: response regulator [Gammaproteobacteria bacterium]|nr:response regulator [Gammaproteobacteria bacterium]
MTNIHPYYHPTKVALIDDDAGFLNSLSRQLEKDTLFQCYSDANTALSEINTQFHPGIYETCRGIPTEQIGLLSAQLVPWDFSCIFEQVVNQHRFQETSVAVIDYRMPSMNGLELCEKINRPETRKILLTGLFDTSDAINALNDGIISAYLNKNDDHLSEKLNSIIHKQQHAYFTEINRPFFSSGAEIPYFFSDNAFRFYLLEVLDKYDICEYYLTTDPYGILMFGKNKHDYYRLLVYTEEEMRAQREIAESEYAPPELTKQLALNTVIPDFWRTSGVYEPLYAKDWKQYVFKPTKLANDKQGFYYCHLQYRPPAYEALINSIVDFNSSKNDLRTCLEF